MQKRYKLRIIGDDLDKCLILGIYIHRVNKAVLIKQRNYVGYLLLIFTDHK